MMLMISAQRCGNANAPYFLPTTLLFCVCFSIPFPFRKVRKRLLRNVERYSCFSSTRSKTHYVRNVISRGLTDSTAIHSVMTKAPTTIIDRRRLQNETIFRRAYLTTLQYCSKNVICIKNAVRFAHFNQPYSEY